MLLIQILQLQQECQTQKVLLKICVVSFELSVALSTKKISVEARCYVRPQIKTEICFTDAVKLQIKKVD